MKRQARGRVWQCASVLLLLAGPVVPAGAEQDAGRGAFGTGEAAGGTDSVEDLRRELEAARARLEALERQLNVLQHSPGSTDGPGSLPTATPPVAELVEGLRQEVDGALERARMAREEAGAQAVEAQSEVLRRALEALSDAAGALEESVQGIDFEELEGVAETGADREAREEALRAIRKSSRVLHDRIQAGEAALRDAERRVRRARRQSGTLSDIVGEQETGEGDRVAVGSDTVVDAGEKVTELVVLGGDGTVLGVVSGDAVVLGGDLRVKDGGQVGGDAVVMGGRLRVDDGATVGGQRVVLSASSVLSGLVGGGRTGVRPPAGKDEGSGLFSRIRTAMAFYLVLVAAGLLSLTFIPDRMRNIAQVLEARAWKSGLLGMLTLVAAVPMTVILVLTIVGILVIPFFYGALALAGFGGLSAVTMVLARRLPYKGGPRTLAGTILWGSAIFTVASLLPFVGPLLCTAGALFGLGAVFLSRFGRVGVETFPY